MKVVAPTELVRIRTRWFLQKSRSSRAATVNLLHKMRDCPSILSPPLSVDCIYGRISIVDNSEERCRTYGAYPTPGIDHFYKSAAPPELTVISVDCIPHRFPQIASTDG